ncbi:MAG: Clp1/GlmU family protein [Candidatus Bathyarchaeia archaeon]
MNRLGLGGGVPKGAPEGEAVFDFKAGEFAILLGPALARIKSGSAEAFGAVLDRGRPILVRSGNSLPMAFGEDSILWVRLGEGGELRRVPEDPIPRSWRDALDAVWGAEGGAILVVGGPDSGKNAFCIMAANGLIDRAGGALIIDADVGQCEIGPPGTICASRARAAVSSLSELPADLSVFIGRVSPHGVEDRIIAGIGRLIERLAQGSPAIVNTDGWLEGDGLPYKARMIEGLRPSLVVGIGELGGLEDTISAPTIRIGAPEMARAKPRGDRRAHRRARFRRALSPGSIREFGLASVELRGFQGKVPEDTLLGLEDGEGFLLGLGLLKDLDKSRGVLKAYTGYGGPVAIIEAGGMRVSEEGDEL